MNADRKPMKQNLDTQVDRRQPQPPPMTEDVGMAEQVKLLERISRLPEIRFDKVQRMRELIARGEFETPERINGTVERLMKELGL